METDVSIVSSERSWRGGRWTGEPLGNTDSELVIRSTYGYCSDKIMSLWEGGQDNRESGNRCGGKVEIRREFRERIIDHPPAKHGKFGLDSMGAVLGAVHRGICLFQCSAFA